MKKLRKILFYIILIEYLIIFILLSINISKLKEENKKLNNKVEKIEIQCKLFYEDIIELIEK